MIEYDEKIEEEIVYTEKGTNRPIVTILKKSLLFIIILIPDFESIL